MTRRWPEPDWTRTLHGKGDIHFSAAGGGIDSSRPPIVQAGFAKSTTPKAAATLVTGDCTTNGTTSEYALYNAYISSLLAEITPWYGVPGNHDALSGGTFAEAAAALGMSSGAYAVDLGFVVLIGFTPGDTFAGDNGGSVFTDANLAALDALIAAQTKPVVLFSHFPPYGSVGALADPALAYRSIDNGFYLATKSNTANSDGFLSMLAPHAQVELIMHGHTHSNLGTDGFVTTITAGTNKILSVNTSALASVDRAPNTLGRYAYGGLNTIYVTRAADRQWEVRYRAHDGGGYWTTRGVGGELVTGVDLR